MRISRALQCCIEYQKLSHLTFISLSYTCSKNLFTSHFPQRFCQILHFTIFTFWFFCSYICYELFLCHIFLSSDVSSTVFHHLSQLVFFVAIYVINFFHVTFSIGLICLKYVISPSFTSWVFCSRICWFGDMPSLFLNRNEWMLSRLIQQLQTFLQATAVSRFRETN